MVRNIIAIIIGTVVGGVLIAAGTFAINLALPYAEIPTTLKEMKDFTGNAPMLNQVILALNWTVCGFVAATITTFIQGRTDYRPMLATIGILQLITYMNMLMLPGYSGWMWLFATFIYILVGLISYRLIRKPRYVESN